MECGQTGNNFRSFPRKGNPALGPRLRGDERRDGKASGVYNGANKLQGAFMSQAAEKRGGIPAMLKDAAFVWEDPLDLESELTEDERMVRNTTRGFAQSYLMPRVTEAFH